MECEKAVMENVYYLVQIGLAAVIFWYTLETRALRITSQHQLAEQKRINELSLLPYFSPGITLFACRGEDKEAIAFFEKDTYLPHAIRQEYQQLLAQGTKIFQIGFQNAAPSMALDLQAVIYDGFAKNYIFGETGVTASRQGEQEYIYTARDTYRTKSEITGQLNAFYENNDFVEPHLGIAEGDQNKYFVFLFGRTIGGRLFLFKREFEIAAGGVTLRKIDWHLQ